MSVTGSGPDNPQRVGVPDRRPARGHVRRLRRGCRPARAQHHGHGPRRPDLPAGRGGRGRTPCTAPRYTVAGHVGHAQGNHHPSISPYGLFHCADGDVQVACGSESLWVKLAEGFGIDPAAEGMATNRERIANREQVAETVNAAFSTWRLDDLLPRLAELGVPSGEVRTHRPRL